MTDWNKLRELAKPKNEMLKSLNSYLEQTGCMLALHYLEFIINKQLVTAEAVKNKFLGIREKDNTLPSLIDYHNLQMKEVLAYGTIKNHYSTAKYLKEFVSEQFQNQEIYLSDLDYQFIAET